MSQSPNRYVPLLEPSQSNPHVTVNAAAMNFDHGISGAFTKALTGTYTLTAEEAQNLYLEFSGTTAYAVTIPANPPGRWWLIKNATTGGALSVGLPSTTPVSVPQGRVMLVRYDGSALVPVGTTPAIAALTNSMGTTTTDGTLEALSTTYTRAEIERNLSELNAKIDALRAAVKDFGVTL